MKVILDIKEENQVPIFMEMIKNLKYISVIKLINDPKKSKFVSDLSEAFEDVRLYEEGKKKLKTAKDLLSEF